MQRYVLILGILLVCGGCHTFRPAPIETLAPGQSVRVRVSGAYSDSLTTLLGRDDARELEGVLVDNDGAGGVLLDVPVESVLEGMRFQTLNQRVEIPADAFVDAEVRELDRTRTFVTFGVVGGVIGAIIVAQLSGDSGGGTIPGGGGPVEAVVSWDVIPALLSGWPWPR